MLEPLRKLLIETFGMPETHAHDVAQCVTNFVNTDEFALHYAGRKPSVLHSEFGAYLNRMEKSMSQLTEALLSAATALKANKGAVVTPESITTAVHGVVDPIVADLNNKITDIVTSEKTDADKIADITDALTQFSGSVAGPADVSAPAAGAPTPAPAEEQPVNGQGNPILAPAPAGNTGNAA